MSYSNRLARETSPYLLQHAHNPVDWYPWGPEAFEAARLQNKPIFLSVGYSTCYWCHVMERQSFENPAIAKEMNDRFINIKVDREERPDVDQLYMTAVQVLTHHGGWPMSVFLLPNLRPFYGGTYFPPADSHGRPGFVTLLKAIEDAYRNRREDVNKSADQILNILKQLAQPLAPSREITIDTHFVENLIARSTSDYDPVNGGFGSAPKFPRETLLELLLTEKSQIKNRKSQIKNSLDAMANGGIRDHLGGGFHRYSTDAHWLVPHFEIMLYDNAMLGWIYTEASRQFDEPRYAKVARGIFDFVLREMTSHDGAFYTAFDAEVDAMEGEPYVWTADQVKQILSREEADLFSKVYGLDRGPNFADPHHGSGQPDKNVLYLPDGPAMEDDPRTVAIRRKLYEARRKKKQPLLDTKIITSWNALMIRSLAHAGNLLKEERYLAAASQAARLLLDHHKTPDGALYRTSRDGQAKYAGFLDDYAFMVQALLALDWKDQANELAEVMVRKFGDESGGFFFTEAGAADLVVRQKVASDSPLPSGNAVATMCMLDLGHERTARKTIGIFVSQLQQQGEGMSAMVQAAMRCVREQGPILVNGSQQSEMDRPLSPRELAERVVRVEIRWLGETEVELTLNILPPFHINGHEPSTAGLVGTEVRVQDARVAEIAYPHGDTYRGQAVIKIRLADHPAGKVQISLKYQACDESACLETVTRQIEINRP
ncbi:MAG TPA: thioredoxin domain-containing protein [Tepidisphaeraceae bacterium]|nr:thioredoxin domain-containing protein [Tepidisphaeraceae bacterium]